MEYKNVTTNICSAINCPFKDINGHGGCARYTISAMCHLNKLFDFRDMLGKRWRHNQYWIQGDNVTEEELDLLKSENEKFLEKDKTENPRMYFRMKI